MAIYKLLVGVDAAQLQNGVAHSGFDQHGNVAARFNLNDDLAHRNAKHVLVQRFVWNALVLTLQRLAAHQMHNHFQAHLAAHGRLAKNRLDVEQANTAHFEQVLQQLGTAPLDGGLVDAVQIDRVVGHHTVPARDQLQPQLAFAQA